MPTKSVSWTQQPVLATDLQSIHFDRTASGYNATVVYEVRDQTNAVRFTATSTQAIASYPASLTAILAAINAIQGT
jgi:hypothetical protein